MKYPFIRLQPRLFSLLVNYYFFNEYFNIFLIFMHNYLGYSQFLIIFNSYQRKKLMILKFLTNMQMFSTVKHQLYKGRYFIQAPPKRPLTSYLLYTTEARKQLPPKAEGQKANVAQEAKLFGSQWKQLKPEDKQKYDKKAQQLRSAYQIQKGKYQAKFVDPFKKTNYNNLLMKEFYSKNKFNNLTEGAKAFQQFRKTLKEEDLDKYKKLADQTNKANQHIIQKYEIPTLKYKDLNSYLRELRKNDPSIPLKSKLEEKDLAKYEKDYNAEKEKYQSALKNFSKSFSIKTEDLIKIINKQKDPSEKLDQEGRSLKQISHQEKQKAAEQVKSAREKANAEKKKIRQKKQKQMKRQIKKIDKELEKKKRGAVRVQNKYTSKLNKIQREKQELELEEKAVKKIENKRKQEANTTKSPAENNPPQKTEASTLASEKKKPGRPKKNTSTTPKSQQTTNKKATQTTQATKAASATVEAKN